MQPTTHLPCVVPVFGPCGVGINALRMTPHETAPQRSPARRERRSLRASLALAVLPTVTILLVFAFVEAWSKRQLLFASLASSAFLIYIDPEHRTNSTRTLVIAQGMSALIGFTAHALCGPSFWGAGMAMVAVILCMILLDAMHPPAVSTALSFALSAGTGSGLALFMLCIGLIVLLVVLQRASLWLVWWTLRWDKE